MKLLISGLLTGAIALTVVPSSLMARQSATVQSTPPAPSPSAQSHSPHRLTINVAVAEPTDLKVKEGQDIKAGELVADRGRERSRLEAQKSQILLTLQRLKSATISQPLPPAAVPAVAPLPQPSYLEQEAAIDRAKVAVEQAEQAIALKQKELTYLQGLSHLDPLIFEHEQAKLAELQQEHDGAVRDYQLAIGRLDSAQKQRAYTEYQNSIDLAQRIEAHNQAALEYQQQLAAYEQRQRDKEYQVSQTQLKLNEVNNAIATLATVKAPYAGQIRRIKWMGQGADGSLSVAITLLIGDRSTSTLPGEQSRLHQYPERSSDRPQ